MLKLLLAAALLVSSVVPSFAPAIAKGPKPAPAPEECRDDQWLTVCTYSSQSECLSAARALRRERPSFVSGCYLSTADPDYWHYGQWVLEYAL